VIRGLEQKTRSPNWKKKNWLILLIVIFIYGFPVPLVVTQRAMRANYAAAL
jgi:hypothetical protein